MSYRLLKGQVTLAIFGLLLFNSTEASEEYAGAVSQKVKEDSIKHHHRDDFKRNSIRLDLLGKSLPLGFAYDRIVYHKKFDLHANIGSSPYQLIGESIHSLNGAFYYSTNKYKVNFIGGPAFNFYRSYSRGSVAIPNEILLFGGITIGVEYGLEGNWVMQVVYAPNIGYMIEYNNGMKVGEQFFDGPNGSALIWQWGGLNVGYKF